MKRVMAQGTFDILHPGHLYYFRESASQGDELVVVIAKDVNVSDEKQIVFDECERREMVASLEIVDRAVLGSETDIYSTVSNIDPDIITLGYDQNHEANEVKNMAEEATGHKVDVVRIDEKCNYSSSDIR